jgi:hypothetical protein
MKYSKRSGTAGATAARLLFSERSSHNGRLEAPVGLWRARFLAALAVVAILGFWIPEAGAAPTMVLDSGFENVSGVPTNNYSLFTGSIGDGWTVSAGEILIERGAVNGLPHSGFQYAYLDGDYALNTLSQVIPTSPGRQYTLSFWIADTDPNFFETTFGGQTLYHGPAPGHGGNNTQYVFEDFTVVATTTSSALTFSGQWTSGLGTILDDVSLVEVIPEPSSTLLFAAFLTLAWKRWKPLKAVAEV